MILVQVLLLALFTNCDVIVNQITGLTSNNLMYTGSIPVSASSPSNLFFTYYGIDGQTDPSKLSTHQLFICVGSPGSSAQYMNLGGLGPLILHSDLSVQKNENSITQFANVMFLDLLGSGFSIPASPDEIPTSGKAVGQQLTYAINIFLNSTDIGKSSSIHLVGEGTFIRSLPGLDDIDPLNTIVHLSPWPDFYDIGKYYGVAGVDYKLLTNTERLTIEATFANCYNYQYKQKYQDAHKCYDTTLNYIEANTNNHNLFDVRLGTNLTDFLPMIQYYFSQPSTVAQYKAPNTGLFSTDSAKVHEQLYTEMGKNMDEDISRYFKDYLSVKHVFLVGQQDYICYYKGIQNWLATDVTFVESTAFNAKKLEDWTVDGDKVGYTKSVKQISYFEVINSGHYIGNNQPKAVVSVLKTLLSRSNKMLQYE